MTEIRYIDRATKTEKIEKVYGQFFLELMYGNSIFSELLAYILLPCIAKLPFFSRFYGLLQKAPFSKKKIVPFIRTYQVDATEFLEPIETFRSFNDFFIRKLNPNKRPIATGDHIATLPADARYLFFPNIQNADGFVVKAKKFSLESLLQDKSLADKYQRGSMVIARLCPVDYHRFHFSCEGIPEKARLINGPLFAVNPIALKKNIDYLTENKRMITEVQTTHFGNLLYIEIGATNVGSICQTFTPGSLCVKGSEKGYFSFGGSCMIILFEPDKIEFDPDLLEASKQKIETYALFGQSMGHAIYRRE